MFIISLCFSIFQTLQPKKNNINKQCFMFHFYFSNLVNTNNLTVSNDVKQNLHLTVTILSEMTLHCAAPYSWSGTGKYRTGNPITQHTEVEKERRIVTLKDEDRSQCPYGLCKEIKRKGEKVANANEVDGASVVGFWGLGRTTQFVPLDK